MSNISLFYEGKKIVEIVNIFSCTLVSRVKAGNLNFEFFCMYSNRIVYIVSEFLAIIEEKDSNGFSLLRRT